MKRNEDQEKLKIQIQYQEQKTKSRIALQNIYNASRTENPYFFEIYK